MFARFALSGFIISAALAVFVIPSMTRSIRSAESDPKNRRALATSRLADRDTINDGAHPPGRKLTAILKSRKASIAGVTYDSKSGEPITGVTVAVISLGATTLSDDVGEFALDGLVVGTNEVTFSQAGYLRSRIDIEVKRGSNRVKIPLDPSPPLRSVIEIEWPIETLQELEAEQPRKLPDGFYYRS